MQDFQQRVVTEKTELNDKLSRLKPFLSGPIFSKLPEEEQELLTDQLAAMEDYSTILGKRIARFAD